jgi:diguanylate cyclase (GGDEF)-like protein
MNNALILLSGVAILAIGVGVGMMLTRLRLAPETAHLESKLKEASRRQDELSVTTLKVQAENKNLSSFLVMLPEVARRLNSHLEKRNIGPLLANVLQHIFEPSRIMVFFTNRDEKKLYLAFKQGMGEQVPLGLRVDFSDGMIGWVASNKVTMDRDDFHNQTEGIRRSGPLGRSLESSFSIDLLAPMIYEDECLGVLCVGGYGKKPSDHKRMIKMTADLGSLALHNHMLYTWFQGMANSDALTKLYTKRFLMIKMGEEIHKAEQSSQPLSVFIFDLDHFKKYNDGNGHLAGDELLRTLGQLIGKEIRGDDIAARYGGEEFVILLPNTKKEDALILAEKIRKKIEETPFLHAANQPLGRVSISGGVSTLGSDGKTTNELLGAADQALYKAKGAGRNRVEAFRFKYLSDEEGVRA